jgi:uncharacterized protein (TIGR01777 family)
MRILLTGATGLIGSALTRLWQPDHQLTALTRSPDKAKQKLGPCMTAATDLAQLNMNQFDVVVNLAGEPIADKRWSKQQKLKICQSRWQLTEQLAEKIQQATTPPHTLINASAIGFYGRQSNKIIDESFQSYHSEFSHDVCARWEELANRTLSARTRVCILRIGIVVAPKGGALQKMLPAFRLGLGGRIGNGEQSMSWIHIDDLTAAFDFLLRHAELTGVFNATAPIAVNNQQWTRLLAERLNRPALLPMPSMLIRLLFGEMGDLLLYGQNVYPRRLLNAGFQFKYSDLGAAFHALPIHPLRLMGRPNF